MKRLWSSEIEPRCSLLHSTTLALLKQAAIFLTIARHMVVEPPATTVVRPASLVHIAYLQYGRVARSPGLAAASSTWERVQEAVTPRVTQQLHPPKLAETAGISRSLHLHAKQFSSSAIPIMNIVRRCVMLALFVSIQIRTSDICQSQNDAPIQQSDVAMQFVSAIRDGYRVPESECWKVRWRATTKTNGLPCTLSNTETSDLDPIWTESVSMYFRLDDGVRFESDTQREANVFTLDIENQFESWLSNRKKVGATFAGYNRSLNIGGQQCTSAYDFWPFLLHSCLPTAGANQNRFEFLPRENQLVTLKWNLLTIVDAKLWIDDADGYSLRKLVKEVKAPNGVQQEVWEIENQKIGGVWFPLKMTRKIGGIPIDYEFDAPQRLRHESDWLSIKIPKGSTVNDSVQGIAYVEGATSRNEEDLMKIAESAKRLLDDDSPVTSVAPSSRNWIWPGMGILLIVLAIAAYRIYRQKTTNT